MTASLGREQKEIAPAQVALLDVEAHPENISELKCCCRSIAKTRIHARLVAPSMSDCQVHEFCRLETIETSHPGPSKAQLFLSDLYFTTFVERFWETGRSEYVMAKVLGISKSERVVSTYVCDDVMHSRPKTVRSICAINGIREKGNRQFSGFVSV